MKKKIYFTIIGIGAILAIIGFIPGGMSGIWGVLIAGITGALYFFNTRNEAKVAERLEGEEESFQRDVADSPDAAAPSEEPEEQAPPEEESQNEENPSEETEE
jgi:prolipoprotein diacylglyceryltransferase